MDDLGTLLVFAGWGIYDAEGDPLATFDTFLDFGFAAEYILPTFPIARGQLANYDKVTTPETYTARFLHSGTVDERSAILQALDAAVASVDNYNVVTPEKTYTEANLRGVKFERKEASRLLVELAFTQIRIVEPQYSESVENPQSAEPSASGKVQPEEPDEKETSILVDIFGGGL